MKAMSKRSKQALGLALVLLATACVSTRLEPGTDHPANAKAESLPLPARDRILASAPITERSSPTGHAHDHAAPMADVYTCPMHPEIVKNAPGQCPICGMNLVKKQSAAPDGAAH
jgi:hypothetical protein